MSTLPDLFIDRVPVSNLLSSIISRWRASSPTRKSRYWSTPPRSIGDDTREILEVSFAVPRLVNNLAFRTAHFPHVVTAEYQEANSDAWQPFVSVKAAPDDWWEAVAPVDRPTALKGDPVKFVLADSMPVRVNVASAIGFDHPQHFGANHWMPVSWRVKPASVTRVRLVLVRNALGTPPADPFGKQATYSLGVRDFQVGYRINSYGDLPRFGDPDTGADVFASSIDLLGSRVVYSARTSPARNVTDGLDETVWRSDPQPINYSVVNFFADTRDNDGNAQVIDRFYVDPLTVGPHINLYHSDSDPTTQFSASDDALLVGNGLVHEGVEVDTTKFLQDQFPDAIRYSATATSVDHVQNSDIQFDPTRPWWLGVSQRFQGSPSDDRTWLGFGPSHVGQTASGLVFTTEGGQSVSLPYDPLQAEGSIVNFAVAYSPEPFGTSPASITLSYRFADRDPVIYQQGIETLLQPVTTIDIGGINTGFYVKALILKEGEAGAGDVEAFLTDPSAYVLKSDYAALDTHTTDNALLRQHPRFVIGSNLSGLVGAPPDRYADMVWTPIARDYNLKRGFLHVPVTKAKFWKFEFTGLIGEQYESFVPIQRRVKVFRAETVQHYIEVAGFGGYTPSDSGSGIQTMLDLTDVNRYSDALDLLSAFDTASVTGHSPTEVLYARDPSQQARIRGLGWIWNYQPWQTGSSAPRFTTTGHHVYETLTILHSTKVAYFVGLKALRAYRVDYTVDDDTEQYVDYFHDQDSIESSNGVTFGVNKVVASSSLGEVVSKTFESRRAIRGIQFATQQSDAAQVLPDDGFVDDELGDHWAVYGDATLTLDLNHRQVEVNRGYFARSYGALESGAWGSYAALETRPYGELEGGQSNGLAGGGMDSETFSPSHSGRVYGAARISAPDGLTAPIEVQIVGTDSGTVLASTSRMFVAGETAVVWTGYTVGSVTSPVTYGDIEAGATQTETPPITYGDMEGGTYGDNESLPIVEDVFIRVVQPGPTRDHFTVKRQSGFDSPVAWEFSMDDGAHWYDAMDIRNNPNGVLIFPGFGTQLKWRMRLFRPGSTVQALHIRPWYLGDLGAVSGNHPMHMLGPNRSVVDVFPSIEDDPMWKQWDQPIPHSWYDPPKTTSQQGNVAPGPPINPPPEPPRVPILVDAADSVGGHTDSADGRVILPTFLDPYTSDQSDPNARGLRWTYTYYGPGQWIIYQNTLTLIEGDPVIPSLAVVYTGRADGTVGITFSTTGGGSGFIFRFVDVNNYWLVKKDGLYKVQAGVTTQVASWTAIPEPFRIDVTMLANTIVVLRDSITMTTLTDSFNAANGVFHGVWRTA